MSKRSDGEASAASIEDAFCEWRVKHRKNLSCQLLFYHVQCTPDNFIHIIIFILSQASAEQDICFLFRKLCILCIECAVFLIVRSSANQRISGIYRFVQRFLSCVFRSFFCSVKQKYKRQSNRKGGKKWTIRCSKSSLPRC